MTDTTRIKREQMVETQIASRSIKDTRVLDAMRRIPRHAFCQPDDYASAYEDHPLSIGSGQTISQPYMVAVMTELLDLRPTDRVLEIGTGSGYQTAILAQLAGEVFSVERHGELAEKAVGLLQGLGYENVTISQGDGTKGYAAAAPYDAVLVTAGAPSVPESLKAQLAVGGRLVCPVGERGMQELHCVFRDAAGFRSDTSTRCIFVPLIGEEGWPVA